MFRYLSEASRNQCFALLAVGAFLCVTLGAEVLHEHGQEFRLQPKSVVEIIHSNAACNTACDVSVCACSHHQEYFRAGTTNSVGSDSICLACLLSQTRKSYIVPEESSLALAAPTHHRTAHVNPVRPTITTRNTAIRAPPCI